ncbi:hypothetical protein L6452_03190 [Arctium lappa]|uniref:Uncharacterized protein n=1 Tax=Arctium lappa TaxID=4217 RepID=A0ACB9FMR6_ARCLA|nr:hypothetical protein L6452_03190 [Arctium lappa]
MAGLLSARNHIRSLFHFRQQLKTIMLLLGSITRFFIVIVPTQKISESTKKAHVKELLAFKPKILKIKRGNSEDCRPRRSRRRPHILPSSNLASKISPFSPSLHIGIFSKQILRYREDL